MYIECYTVWLYWSKFFLFENYWSIQSCGNNNGSFYIMSKHHFLNKLFAEFLSIFANDHEKYHFSEPFCIAIHAVKYCSLSDSHFNFFAWDLNDNLESIFMPSTMKLSETQFNCQSCTKSGHRPLGCLEFVKF